MSSNQGIQTLLEAEKEAAKTVDRARQYRVQKLKDARSEAAKEIDELKARKTAELAQYEQQHTGSSGQLASEIEVNTQNEINQLEQAFNTHREEVLNKLLEIVTKVDPQIHPNAKPVE
ncbi:hypothetical protein H4R33_003570 [Dimargaris cristalligena]|uniref:V-type proton ATPase subunit G n=1 Tax=Dimargaris cristalligena TaxID=215637 RepID=A0A4P9ZMG5_9FUNG|nr:hypothetical protein H4R33_003570 [Dimargaris cristalligena]RKP34576.1 V-type ATPase [Dimargaris cristalligena]|eukprot:RKP34576.1 V-type ATPase [Dimargaris cristalligena]